MKQAIQFLTAFFLMTLSGFPCSMCKVTINGRTFLGSNEDSWRMGSRIWFENKTFGRYGAVYVGYGDGFPQGGMNEAGVAFDGLTVYPKQVNSDPAKKMMTDPTAFIKAIMQNCETVEEVKAYANQYNRTAFNRAVLLFSDKSGRYLVIEPDTMILGNDSKYIIANFCPSTTTESQKLDFGRYKRGEVFLQNHANDTRPDYAYALIDTMHECRTKVGDGTMYSYVAALDSGILRLYFYHDFSVSKDFNLKEELAKGDHQIEMTTLFPPNAEYRKFLSFQTPQTSHTMLLVTAGFVAFFAFSFIYFLIAYLLTKKGTANRNTKLLVALLSMLLSYYCFVLIRNQPIFYLPSPYQDYKFSVLNVAAYIPFLLLFAIVPMIRQNLQIVNNTGWNWISRSVFSLNSLCCVGLVALFAYWKLYNVF